MDGKEGGEKGGGGAAAAAGGKKDDGRAPPGRRNRSRCRRIRQWVVLGSGSRKEIPVFCCVCDGKLLSPGNAARLAGGMSAAGLIGGPPWENAYFLDLVLPCLTPCGLDDDILDCCLLA